MRFLKILGFIGVVLMAADSLDDFWSLFDIDFVGSYWVSVLIILVGVVIATVSTARAEDEEKHEEKLRERRMSRNR
jgi:predicted tellurium resistance membrane protein TerC